MISAALEQARLYPRSVVAVFQDEASFYRQPSQGCLWHPRGRRQPRMPWSHRSNTLVRAAGCLDAVTGQLQVLQATKIDVPHLIESYRKLLEAYPETLMIYLIQDNWPVHFHEKVREYLAANPRLQVLRLPTYAPRLNWVEKLWKWTRQTLCHAHPFCDNFKEFQRQLSACFNEAAALPDVLGKYCGIRTSMIFSA